jgi:RNA polymerase sigma factor (sigma-70 family)
MCSACREHPESWTDERTLTHYRNLAYSVLNQFVRTYGIPREDVRDFEQEMLTRLVSAPEGYRAQSAGMYTILKNTAIKFVERYNKHANRKYVALDADDCRIDIMAPADLSGLERDMDAHKLAELLDLLPGPERVCLALYYGIGYQRPHPVSVICRKLGAPRGWVDSRIMRAENMLKSWVGRTSLTSEATDARCSSSTTARSSSVNSGSSAVIRS